LAILGQKSLDRFKNTFQVQNKKYSPFLSQNDKRKQSRKISYKILPLNVLAGQG
jgi:hypothetical protein